MSVHSTNRVRSWILCVRTRHSGPSVSVFIVRLHSADWFHSFLLHLLDFLPRISRAKHKRSNLFFTRISHAWNWLQLVSVVNRMSTATTTTSTTTTTTPRTTTTQVATTTRRVNAAASDQLLYVTNRPWDTMNHFNPAGSGGNGIDYPLIPSRPSYNKRRGTTLNAKPPVHDSITCNTRRPTGRTSLHDQHCHHQLSLFTDFHCASIPFFYK